VCLRRGPRQRALGTRLALTDRQPPRSALTGQLLGSPVRALLAQHKADESGYLLVYQSLVMRDDNQQYPKRLPGPVMGPGILLPGLQLPGSRGSVPSGACSLPS